MVIHKKQAMACLSENIAPAAKFFDASVGSFANEC